MWKAHILSSLTQSHMHGQTTHAGDKEENSVTLVNSIDPITRLSTSLGNRNSQDARGELHRENENQRQK